MMPCSRCPKRGELQMQLMAFVCFCFCHISFFVGSTADAHVEPRESPTLWAGCRRLVAPVHGLFHGPFCFVFSSCQFVDPASKNKSTRDNYYPIIGYYQPLLDPSSDFSNQSFIHWLRRITILFFLSCITKGTLQTPQSVTTCLYLTQG